MYHNLEIESMVLGCMVYDTEQALDVVSKCSIDDFYSGDHRIIFKAIAAQIAKTELSTDLLLTDIHSKLTNPASFTDAITNYSSFNVDGKIEKLKEFTKKRVIYNTCTETIEQMKEDCDPAELINKIESKIFNLTELQEQNIKKLSDYTEFVSDNYNMFKETKYKTGIMDIDDKIMLHDGLMYVLAAAPGAGKTSFVTNLITKIAHFDKIPTLLFSQEASGEMVNFRIGHTFGSGSGYDKYKSGIEKLKDAPLYIEDQSGLTLNKLRSKALRYIKRYDIQLIAIDYLQLMTGQGENQNARTSYLSKGITALAKDTNTCWIVLSQITKEGLKRDAPTMADLRDSGQIAQDARGIYLLYNGDTENTVWFKCDKQNFGQAGWKQKIYFDKENNQFSDLDEDNERVLKWYEKE